MHNATIARAFDSTFECIFRWGTDQGEHMPDQFDDFGYSISVEGDQLGRWQTDYDGTRFLACPVYGSVELCQVLSDGIAIQFDEE